MIFEKFSLISLKAIFRAASSDSPKDDEIPVNGRRAPNVTVCLEPAGSANTIFEFALLLANDKNDGVEDGR
jgi:hypothetical protein